jgi:hypothetical protein
MQVYNHYVSIFHVKPHSFIAKLASNGLQGMTARASNTTYHIGRVQTLWHRRVRGNARAALAKRVATRSEGLGQTTPRFLLPPHSRFMASYFGLRLRQRQLMLPFT